MAGGLAVVEIFVDFSGLGWENYWIDCLTVLPNTFWRRLIRGDKKRSIRVEIFSLDCSADFSYTRNNKWQKIKLIIQLDGYRVIEYRLKSQRTSLCALIHWPFEVQTLLLKYLSVQTCLLGFANKLHLNVFAKLPENSASSNLRNFQVLALKFQWILLVQYNLAHTCSNIIIYRLYSKCNFFFEGSASHRPVIIKIFHENLKPLLL